MELIVIDENKLKIMLTAPDMRHYDLPAERACIGTATTRRAFRQIFEDARARIGFDTEGERLLVELYTSREGGCEIFVTKLGAAESTDASGAVRDPAELALLRRLYKEEDMNDTPTTVAFALSDVSALLAVCRRLDETSESEIYIDGRDRPVLLLTLAAGEDVPPFLSEYADEIPDAESLRLYLSEHGRRLGSAGELGRL